jgi:DNA polymerase-3 subunit chi
MATTFYHLPADAITDASVTDGLAADDATSNRALLEKVCLISAQYYQQGLRVFVATNDVKTAEQLDELMWQLPSEQFIPHNLQGEGPHYGAPIEIGHQPPQTRRQVLINLCHPLPQFAVKFTQIIDFIPNQSEQKQQARERFHQYRLLNLAPSIASE